MRILPAALMTVVSAVFTLAAESAEEEDVRQRMRRDAYPHSSLNLPEQLPEELRIKAVLGGQDVNLVLERNSIRASTFRVAFRQKDGSFVDVVAPPPSTYLGHVVEEPERAALANDHDANGDTIHIAAFDVLSAEGSRIELSAGTGGGLDQLIFTPSATKDPPYSDKFWYTLQDSTGRSHRTGVEVNVRTKE